MVQERAVQCFSATIKSRRMRRPQHVACTIRDEAAYSVLFQKPDMAVNKSIILKCILILVNGMGWWVLHVCGSRQRSVMVSWEHFAEHEMRSDVLSAISTNTAVFLYVTSNNPVKIYQFCYPEGEDSSLLRNVAKFVAGYIVLQLRRR
jgi:hypothetical protein